MPRKLVETAFPVEQVGRHASREKSIRHGHPSTLHLWWSRKPLAAARAVLLAQLLDDPADRPDRFPTPAAQEAERERLLDLVARSSAWGATADAALMTQVRDEVRQALADAGADRPLLWDPFAGGGSIPLEAQRLGVPVLAGDLNPVAVLLQRALLELPRRWQHRPLVADLRAAGERVLARAAARLAAAYPPVEWGGRQHQVAAYLWVRTVPCGDPACGATVPMLSNPWLDRRPGRSTWLEPIPEGAGPAAAGASSAPPASAGPGFRVRTDGEPVLRGDRGPVFGCPACGRPTVADDVKGVALSRGLGRVLRCVVPDAGARRPFLVLPEDAVSPSLPAELVEAGAEVDLSLPLDPAVSNAPTYGIRTLADLQLPRQRAAMAVFAQEVRASRGELAAAAAVSGLDPEDAEAYAADLVLLLGLVLGRLANRMSTACIWNAHRGLVEQTFIQNTTIAFPWDFAEANPLSRASGSWVSQLDWVARAVERCDPAAPAEVVLADARSAPAPAGGTDGRTVLVSTDPPYFDYFLYSSLSDWFYAWLRPALADVAPELLAAAQTPKQQEIVGREDAGFMADLGDALGRIARTASPDFPVTIWYAYRAAGAGSVAWQSFLGALQAAGLTVTATWPIRTERTEGVKTGRNSLASSIVVVCRRRPADAVPLDRPGFVAGLRRTVPATLDLLLESGIAPVDLAQAALGQGMAVYTAASEVTAADGRPLPLAEALGLVERAVTEALERYQDQLSPAGRAGLELFSRNGSVPEMASAEGHGPSSDEWTAVLRLAEALRVGGLPAASALAAELVRTEGADLLERCHPLLFLAFRACERRRKPRLGTPFNALGSVWRDLVRAADTPPAAVAVPR